MTFDRSKLCFDAIFIRMVGESYNPMPLEEFLALHVDERIALIMRRKLRFYSGEHEVAIYDAVKSIGEARG